GLGLGLTLPQRALVGALLLELGRELRKVVREQARPRVTQVALHGLRLARRLGLPAERSELTAQLRGEVAQAREVALHRVELAQRLLLALAVLQDACGLLDDAAALLRRGAQDGVELALADHDVHLAPDAGVAEQLLDVEQAARVAVDGVLGAAAAEQRARDRHLGVVDRQRAVGVVDRQRDLGTTERGTTGGAREDDVVHLAAAQRLGALLAHDPGQGVYHVRLAGTVGADHAGDARFQLEGGRRREGLESSERERLQVHGLEPNGENDTFPGPTPIHAEVDTWRGSRLAR